MTITKKEAAERLAIIAAEIRLALDEGDEDCPSWADDLLTVADALHPSGFVDESGTGIDTRYRRRPRMADQLAELERIAEQKRKAETERDRLGVQEDPTSLLWEAFGTPPEMADGFAAAIKSIEVVR